jgi:hypothetical protein
MPVLLQIPENPNCDAMDAQVFQCRSAAQVVTHILCERTNDMDRGIDYGMEWCAVTGLDEGGRPCPATACLVEDSGDGACYLVIGGEWGLRLRPGESVSEWDVANANQWGVPYFLLAGDGATLRFA